MVAASACLVIVYFWFRWSPTTETLPADFTSSFVQTFLVFGACVVFGTAPGGCGVAGLAGSWLARHSVAQARARRSTSKTRRIMGPPDPVGTSTIEPILPTQVSRVS